MGHLISKKNLLVRSLLIAAGLTVLKLIVATVTNSVALFASAADSLMDFLVSMINFLFVRSAAKPADLDHPYGHGKLESLAGMFQSMFIGLVAVGIAVVSIRRFIAPAPVEEPLSGVAVTVIAIVISFWHARNLKRSMASTESQVMTSEYVHYASDVLANVGVIASLLLYEWTGQAFWDPLISLAIVLYLIKNVVHIFNNSVGELLDKQLPRETLDDIDVTIRRSHPKISDYHDLRTRKVGETKFIEFHVVLRDVQAFDEAHTITESVISQLRGKFPNSVVTVHTDPEGAMEEHEFPRKPL